MVRTSSKDALKRVRKGRVDRKRQNEDATAENLSTENYQLATRRPSIENNLEGRSKSQTGCISAAEISSTPTGNPEIEIDSECDNGPNASGSNHIVFPQQQQATIEQPNIAHLAPSAIISNMSTIRRALTVRINRIPISTSPEALERDIGSILREFDSENDEVIVNHHHLVRWDDRSACATVVFYTCLNADQLLQRLNQSKIRLGFSYSFDAKFHGITPLYESPGGAQVDVIFVPGLGSHAIGSWKASTGTDVWPRDYLPDDVPNIRILLYGYDSSLVGSDTKDSIEDLGKRFFAAITAFRGDNTHHRPIIFVGHSLGGLLIKEALVHARNRSDTPSQSLSKACYGLLFFGVPNLGLRNEQLRSIVQGQPNQRLVDALVVDDDSEPSPFLKRISDQFSECCKGQYKVVSFFERKSSCTVQIQPDGSLTKTGPKILMVTEKSATGTGLTAVADETNIPLNTDHTGLVKYENNTQDEYMIVKDNLKMLVNEAKVKVPTRFSDLYKWVHERRYCRDKLPVAEGAAFDSHAEEHNARCLPDTRTELLCQIQNWANDAQAESIFWLNGMAGTGKSTISRTVASSFADDGLLGASFFFKRGEGDRGKATLVFPTIASQLLFKIPSLAPFVKKAIDADPAVPVKALREQFEKLILQPLGCIHHTTAIVIVIDALDECDGNENVKTIISVLSQTNAVRSVRLRVFITSRPELPIRLGFKDLQGKYQGLALHQIPEPIVGRTLLGGSEKERTATVTSRHQTSHPSRALSSFSNDETADFTNFRVVHGTHTDSGYVSSCNPLCRGSVGGDLNDLKLVTVVEADDSDARTVYSEEGSLGSIQLDTYKSDLVSDLVSNMSQFRAKPEELEKVFDALPQLLQSFALRLGQSGSSKAERDVMYFVHKHRINLAQMFKQSMLSLDEEESAVNPELEPVDARLTESRINMWLTQSMLEIMESTSGSVQDCGLFPAEEEAGLSARAARLETPADDDVDIALPDRHGYRQIVFESQAYRSLVSSLRREMLLTTVGDVDINAMDMIHLKILDILPRQRHISRHTESNTYTLVFSATWDPVSFLETQYDMLGVQEDILGRVITLTGSMIDAQAVPCSDYMSQTWPTTGPQVLAVVMEAVKTRGQSMRVLLDRSKITASLNSPGRFQMSVSGTPDVIAEVGEIIAWLTAAVRVSLDDDVIQTCSPRIGSAHKLPDSGDYYCEIEFDSKADLDSGNWAGRCWHGMFRNPVVVTGFPVLRRERANSGLEIPLEMAASLTGASRLHEFHGGQFLKGFSAMLAAVEVIGDLVLWHLYYNPTGERISYVKAKANACLRSIGVNKLRSSRHIVGWCSDALYMFGDPSANYDIRNSNLPVPGKDFALEKLSLSVGQIVTGGCQFSVGRKDSPVHITKKTYQSKLQWLAQRYVVMWDEEEKCGWLTKGTSALLHLLRASLEHSAKEEFSNDFLFDIKAFQEATERFRHNSAWGVLRNRTNRELELYEHKPEKSIKEVIQPDGTVQVFKEIRRTFETVEDRVDELFETLDKLVSHEEDGKASKKGVNMKPRVRSYLQGWDFRDVAINSDPFHLRLMTPPAAGRTWVDFASSIGAVTLFGRGFGELIKPAAALSSPRSAWQAMPTGKGLLGACLSDLKEIIHNRGGSRTTHPVMISAGILWHNPSKYDIFTADGSMTGWNPIQELLPESSLRNLPFLRNWGPKVDLDCYQHGAVIFGRTKSSIFTWPDRLGEPVIVGDLTPPVLDDSDDTEATPMPTLGASSNSGFVVRIGTSAFSTASSTQTTQLTSPESSRLSIAGASGSGSRTEQGSMNSALGPELEAASLTSAPRAGSKSRSGVTLRKRGVDDAELDKDEDSQRDGITKRLRNVTLRARLRRGIQDATSSTKKAMRGNENPS